MKTMTNKKSTYVVVTMLWVISMLLFYFYRDTSVAYIGSNIITVGAVIFIAVNMYYGKTKKAETHLKQKSKEDIKKGLEKKEKELTKSTNEVASLKYEKGKLQNEVSRLQKTTSILGESLKNLYLSNINDTDVISLVKRIFTQNEDYLKIFDPIRYASDTNYKNTLIKHGPDILRKWDDLCVEFEDYPSLIPGEIKEYIDKLLKTSNGGNGGSGSAGRSKTKNYVMPEKINREGDINYDR